MKQITIIILAFTCIGFQACEKNKNNLLFNSDNIVGKWEVIYISGGFTGIESYTPNFKYLTIETNGEFSFSNDSTSIADGSYTKELNSESKSMLKFNLNSKYPLSIVNMSTYYPKNIVFFDSNILTLDDPCCNLYSYTFKRVL